MVGRTWRGALELVIGVAIAAAAMHTWLIMGWIVPVTVSGSSMAPTLLGPHRLFFCPKCRHAFAVGLDQLPMGERAVCDQCGQRSAAARPRSDRRGERLAIDRTAFVARRPRRWELVVFRCPERGGELCVKRVVGLPGELVGLAGGDVFVNGQVVGKSLAEQRAVRQLIDVDSESESPADKVRVGDVLFPALERWRKKRDGARIEYHHLANGPILDTLAYNQGPAPPPNRVSDIMLTFTARFAGAGRLVLAAENQAGRFETKIDFGKGVVTLKCNGRLSAERPLPSIGVSETWSEWTFSLFDRQVLLAIDDYVVLVAPLVTDQVSTGPPPEVVSARPHLSLRVDGLSGEIRALTVWRDIYYGVRHGDGRQPGAVRGTTTTWRLGPDEFFVVGDNAAISDDSRDWLSGAGVNAKLLIGKPLGVR